MLTPERHAAPEPKFSRSSCRTIPAVVTQSKLKQMRMVRIFPIRTTEGYPLYL